jgi:hypothetical protein
MAFRIAFQKIVRDLRGDWVAADAVEASIARPHRRRGAGRRPPKLWKKPFSKFSWEHAVKALAFNFSDVVKIPARIPHATIDRQCSDDHEEQHGERPHPADESGTAVD